jgi:hypothetical protein
VYTDEGTYGVMLTVDFADHDPIILVKKHLVTVEKPLRKASQVYLYWIAWYKLYRGDWNGGPSQWLASEWYPPSGMDVGGGKVYWVTTTGTGGELSSMDLDGSNRQIVLREDNRLGSVAVDVQKGKIYWTCWPESPRSVFQPNKTWDGALKRANLDGSDVEILTVYPAGSNVHADRIVVDPESETVYWSETAKIGGNLQTMLMASSTRGFAPHDVMPLVGPPAGMALDTLPEFGARTLYYTVADKLRRASLGGTSEAVLLSGLDAPQGVAVDPYGDRIYFGTDMGIFFTDSEVDLAEAKQVLEVYPMEEKVRAVVLVQ